MPSVPIFKRRIFTRKVIYRLFQLNVGTFQKCKKCSRMRTPRLSRRLPAVRLGYVTDALTERAWKDAVQGLGKSVPTTQQALQFNKDSQAILLPLLLQFSVFSIFSGPKIFNSLDNEIVNSRSLSSFRKIPSSETQGQLVGSIKCLWWKFTVRSTRAPGHLLLPNQFQKRLNCPLLIGQKKIFLANQRRGAAGWLWCFLTRRSFPHRLP